MAPSHPIRAKPHHHGQQHDQAQPDQPEVAEAIVRRAPFHHFKRAAQHASFELGQASDQVTSMIDDGRYPIVGTSDQRPSVFQGPHLRDLHVRTTNIRVRLSRIVFEFSRP